MAARTNSLVMLEGPDGSLVMLDSDSGVSAVVDIDVDLDAGNILEGVDPTLLVGFELGFAT